MRMHKLNYNCRSGGLDVTVNYYGTTNSERSGRPKKIHQDLVITHLDSLYEQPTESQSSPVTTNKMLSVSTDQRLLSVATPSSNLQVVLVGSVIGGISLSKYLL